MEPTRAMAPQGGYCSRRHGEKVDTHPPPFSPKHLGEGRGASPLRLQSSLQTTPFDALSQ